MSTGVLIYAGIGVFGAIIGIYVILLKHFWKHPSADKIVSKDVCESEKHRIEDCIENEVKCSAERYELLTESIKELKGLIQNARR